jgi:hypothetical protein
MFRLHDKTRRRLCMTGFFIFCIAPVLGAIGWCVARNLPWAAENEADMLARQLGLDVRIDGLKYLKPGVVLYEGLQLADPETGQPLLRCRLLEAQWKTIADAQGKSRPALVLVASQPEVQFAGLRQLSALLQRVMQGQAGRPEVDLRISAGELTLQNGVNSQTLTAVEAGLDHPSGGVQAMAAFRLPGSDAKDPVKIRLVRNRQANPPASGFELYTGPSQLPCDLLAAVLPELAGLGPRARFSGYIWANQEPAGREAISWSGEATGQFLGVDLERLVSEHFPHKLSGTAEVTIQSARFARGRLEEASATVVAGPGVVGRSLLQAAVKHLQLQSDAKFELLADQTPYDQLGCDIVLDAHGLKIAGRCPSAQGGVVMADQRLSLLVAGDAQVLPATALIQTLAPESVVQVPATPQTDWLVTHLPMPQAASPQTREAALPPANLRLRK